jgi:hypothetical protein
MFPGEILQNFKFCRTGNINFAELRPQEMSQVFPVLEKKSQKYCQYVFLVLAIISPHFHSFLFWGLFLTILTVF